MTNDKEERRCDWPGCQETTQDPTKGAWFLGGVYEEERKFLSRPLPLRTYNALCPLHHKLLEAAREIIDEELP